MSEPRLLTMLETLMLAAVLPRERYGLEIFDEVARAGRSTWA